MVSRLIRENLGRRASRFNLILDDVSLTHVAFSPAFSDAVEAKQIAQQNAQRAVYLVDQAIQEKQSIIVRAQGEAKSAELIGEAIKQNKGCVQNSPCPDHLFRSSGMADDALVQLFTAQEARGGEGDCSGRSTISEQVRPRLGRSLTQWCALLALLCFAAFCLTGLCSRR